MVLTCPNVYCGLALLVYIGSGYRLNRLTDARYAESQLVLMLGTVFASAWKVHRSIVGHERFGNAQCVDVSADYPCSVNTEHV